MNRDYKKPRLGASWRIGRDVVMNEGRGALYRGLAPNLVGNMASWSLYFMLYVLPQPFFSPHVSGYSRDNFNFILASIRNKYV